MKKVIGATLYALLVVGVCFIMPEPAKASCSYSCELVECSAAPFTYGFLRAPGDYALLLQDFLPCGPCGRACGAYVACQEYPCTASANGTVYFGGENILAFDVRDRKQGAKLMKYLEANRKLDQLALLVKAQAQFHLAGEMWGPQVFKANHAAKLAALHSSCPVVGK